ncbi:MAG: hypothetical protein R3B65_04140 [Candidatus Paceibacterota bacterium]
METFHISEEEIMSVTENLFD